MAGGSRFRVHQSLLCKYCGFFRDLFSVPQPPSTDTSQDYYDGCVVIELGDKCTDTFFFLTALYDRSFLSDSSFFTISKEAISGVIALAYKYDALDLYAEALRRLEKVVSTTLVGLDAVHPSFLPTPPPRSPKPSKPLKSYWPLAQPLACNPIFLINVARHLQTPELLDFVPCAFYIASIYPSAALAHGVPRTPDRVICGDGDPAELSKYCCRGNGGRGLILYNFASDAAKNKCVNETLHPDDRHRVFAGRRALKGLGEEVTRCFRPHRSNIIPACEHRRRATNPCVLALTRLYREAKKDGILTNVNLLARRDDWIDEFFRKTSEEGMLPACKACKDHLKSVHNDARKQVWNELTKHFDLVNWLGGWGLFSNS